LNILKSLILTSGFCSLCAQADIAALSEVMTNAHKAGRCSVISELAEFQRAQKMEGGDAFVIAFVRKEAANRNLSFEALLKECENETGKYGSLSKVITDSN